MMRAMLTSGLILLAMAQAPVRADATLEYQLTPPAGETVSLRFALSGFFARIESSAAADGWWLFQAGKFFPLYRVDDGARTWTRLTPEVTPRLGPASRGASPAATGAAQPAASAPAQAGAQPEPERPGQQAVDAAASAAGEAADTGAAASAQPASRPPTPSQAPTEARTSAAPTFAPTAEMDEVAGVRCRVVEELRNGEPAMEHCMANKAALGLTERETRTLARTFAMAREQGFGWLGTATEDEAFVSVRSRARDGGATLALVSVSTEALPNDHLRVPRAYQEVQREEAQREPQAPEPEPEPASADAAPAGTDAGPPAAGGRPDRPDAGESD